MAQWLQDLSIGDWYEADGDTFEIVGIDTQAEIVLVQHFDGSLGEIEFGVWMELAAQSCAAPEDVSGAFDLDREDLDLDAPLPRRDDALRRLEDRDSA